MNQNVCQNCFHWRGFEGVRSVHEMAHKEGMCSLHENTTGYSKTFAEWTCPNFKERDGQNRAIGAEAVLAKAKAGITPLNINDPPKPQGQCAQCKSYDNGVCSIINSLVGPTASCEKFQQKIKIVPINPGDTIEIIIGDKWILQYASENLIVARSPDGKDAAFERKGISVRKLKK